MNIDDGRIVTEIIKGLLYKKPLTIFGDGSQTRSLSYVSDTVYMISRVMESDYRDPVNVGNNQEISVMDLVNTAQKLHCENFDENELSITFKPIDKDDPKTRQPCLELNRRVIGDFEPTTLEQGLLETIRYFNDQKQTN
jgi:nucleoside-diphosphate-sugar epimerase